jgi:hypothetical protein
MIACISRRISNLGGKMKKVLLASALLALLPISQANAAWPSYGADSGPGLIITLGAGNAVTLTNTGQGPYDGIEDTYIGVVNNSGGTVTVLNLTSGQPIFGFDGDGLAGYGAPSPFDPYGYGGPLGSFTFSSYYSGSITFNGGLADGASTYFSLEERLSAADFSGGGGGITVGAPEASTWAMMLIGFASLGFASYRRAKATAAA